MSHSAQQTPESSPSEAAVAEEGAVLDRLQGEDGIGSARKGVNGLEDGYPITPFSEREATPAGSRAASSGRSKKRKERAISPSEMEREDLEKEVRKLRGHLVRARANLALVRHECMLIRTSEESCRAELEELRMREERRANATLQRRRREDELVRGDNVVDAGESVGVGDRAGSVVGSQWSEDERWSVAESGVGVDGVGSLGFRSEAEIEARRRARRERLRGRGGVVGASPSSSNAGTESSPQSYTRPRRDPTAPRAGRGLRRSLDTHVSVGPSLHRVEEEDRRGKKSVGVDNFVGEDGRRVTAPKKSVGVDSFEGEDGRRVTAPKKSIGTDNFEGEDDKRVTAPKKSSNTERKVEPDELFADDDDDDDGGIEDVGPDTRGGEDDDDGFSREEVEGRGTRDEEEEEEEDDVLKVGANAHKSDDDDGVLRGGSTTHKSESDVLEEKDEEDRRPWEGNAHWFATAPRGVAVWELGDADIQLEAAFRLEALRESESGVWHRLVRDAENTGHSIAEWIASERRSRRLERAGAKPTKPATVPKIPTTRPSISRLLGQWSRPMPSRTASQHSIKSTTTTTTTSPTTNTAPHRETRMAKREQRRKQRSPPSNTSQTTTTTTTTQKAPPTSSKPLESLEDAAAHRVSQWRNATRDKLRSLPLFREAHSLCPRIIRKRGRHRGHTDRSRTGASSVPDLLLPPLDELERSLFPSLLPAVFAASPADADEDERVNSRLQSLQFLQPAKLGVPQRVADSAKHAADEIHSMIAAISPGDKLHHLAAACGKMLQAFADSPDDESTSGGDDLLPAIIWLLLQTKPPKLHSQLQYMARFRSSRALRGRDGYALTTTQIALQHLMELTLDDLGEDI